MNKLKNVLTVIIGCVFVYAVFSFVAPVFGWSDLGSSISLDSPTTAYFVNLSTEDKAHFFFLTTLLLTAIAVAFIALNSILDAKPKADSLTITFTLKGESVRRFRLLSDQYGGQEKLLVSALELIESATVATANGSDVVIRSADGSIERTLVVKVQNLMLF